MNWLRELRKAIMQYFDESEIKELCFDLGVEYDDLSGENRKEKVISLIGYFSRQNKIPELISYCSQVRPDASWDAIAAEAPKATAIIPTPAQIAKLQKETLDALRDGRLTEADIKLEESEELINTALSESPKDIMLLNLKGYHHKNVAMEFQRLSMDDQDVDEQLTEAEKTFRLVLTLNKEDASAWNGLGSVYILRCELDKAEEHIRKALDIYPEYDAAQRDLERIPAYREKCDG